MILACGERRSEGRIERQEITPQSVQAEYIKGQAYNDGLEMYDKVKKCERFYRCV